MKGPQHRDRGDGGPGQLGGDILGDGGQAQNTTFKGAARGRRSLSCGGPRLSVLQNGFHFSDGPAFVSRYHILMARSFRVAGLGMRRPIGYFCPDGACAFELLGSGLLAS